MTKLLNELQLLKEHSQSLRFLVDKHEESESDIKIDRYSDFVSRKFAITMQVSKDKGNSFEIFSDSKFCATCSSKV
jgi:hypothetical protein